MTELYAVSCGVRDEDAFGPKVADSCLGGFDFTLLFEESILTLLPSCIFFLLSILRAAHIWSHTRKAGRGLSYWLKLLFYLILVALECVLLGLWSSNSRVKTQATIATEAVQLVVLFSFAYLSHLEHLYSLRPSTHLALYFGLSVLLDLARTRTLWFIPGNKDVAAVHLAVYLSKVVLLILEIVEKRHSLLEPYKHVSREAASGLYNRSLFLWVDWLFFRGLREIFTVHSLFNIDEDLIRSSEPDFFFEKWDKSNKTWRYSLLFHLMWHHKWTILAGAPPKLAWIGFSYAQPFLIQRVLDFIDEPVTSNTNNVAYGLIAAYAIVYIGIAISYAFYEHKTDRLVLKLRGSLVTMLYRKSLRMHSSDLSDGSALTLMSADIDRIGNGVREFQDLWGSFIEIAIALWLLERLLGVSIIGPALFILMILLAAIPLANLAGNAQGDWLEAIEKRIAVTSKALQSIKSIKLTGSAKSISEIITDLREDEIHESGMYRLYTTFVLTVAYASEDLAPAIGFGTFIILSELRGTQTLTTGIAFAALTLFSLVDQPMMTLVDGLEEFKTLMNCFKRIQEFLVRDEREDFRHIVSSSSSSPDTSITEVSLKESIAKYRDLKSWTQDEKISFPDGVVAFGLNVSARWAVEGKPTLTIQRLSISEKQTTMIIGPVGSGKTTLLRLLLGEVPLVSGALFATFKHAAYCSQAPWIKFGSIRENIIGVHPYEHDWYSQVTQACALNVDFDQLPDGEHTRVGARGSRLSGGQQMRISLARSLYARTPVVILDDALTGLDRTTEQFVLDAVFSRKGLIKRSGQTIILATNSAHQLPFADNIIVLGDDGQVADAGTLEELSNRSQYVNRLSQQRRAINPDRAPDIEITEEILEEMEFPTDDEIQDVARQTGDLKVYVYYFSNAGWYRVVIYLFTAAAMVFCVTFPTIWIQWWTNANETYGTHRVGYWLGVYAALGLLAIIFTFVSSWVLLMVIVPVTARKFHKALLSTTMSATTGFLTGTDVGQTVNRFSQDLELVDLDLPQVFETTILSLLSAIVEGILVFIGSGYVAAAIPGVLLVIYFIQKFYLRTSRQLRLLDIEAKAPLFSNFLETLTGVVSIRAFGWTGHYDRANLKVLNASQKPYYLLFTVQRWLTLVLNLVVAGIAILLVAIVTTVRNSTTAYLGVALFNIVNFGSSLENLITEWTQLEQSIGAISRIRGYVRSVKSEDLDHESIEHLPDSWPRNGLIQLQNVSASYESSTEPVLNNLNLTFKPGEKIALCGRTGSGKSTVLSTLLRMVDLDAGNISIDGIDLATVSRQHVRERLNTLSQEPFFLHGTIRLNADPQKLSDDDSITAALKAVGLGNWLDHNNGLDSDMDEELLSHGQKQLFCLARAMCKPSSVLLLDEATSSVDSDTDALMQSLIRHHFTQQTVIAIAHKLHTIVDFDKVVLLDNGSVIEFDNPQSLLAREGSAFQRLYRTLVEANEVNEASGA